MVEKPFQGQTGMQTSFIDQKSPPLGNFEGFLINPIASGIPLPRWKPLFTEADPKSEAAQS